MAGRKERQRQLARERYERRSRQRAEAAARRRKRNAIIAAAVAVVVVIGGTYFLASGLLGRGDSVASVPTQTPEPPAEVSTPAVGPGECAYIQDGVAARPVGLPPKKPETGKKFRATFVTTRGDIVVDLLDKAPCTVNSFMHLVKGDYYTENACHRLTTKGIFVLQCGDPTGQGSGGPGYRFASENIGGPDYSRGTLAMAHSAQPDSNGSQFFFVYKDSSFDPNTPKKDLYTPFGKVVKGLDIVDEVAKAGIAQGGATPGDGTPENEVIIKKVTITSS